MPLIKIQYTFYYVISYIIPANINDVDPIPEILTQVEQWLGYLPEYVGLDSGYHNSIISKQLYDKGIQPVLGYRRHTHKTDHFGEYRFRYDRRNDCYIPHRCRAEYEKDSAGCLAQVYSLFPAVITFCATRLLRLKQGIY